MQASRDTSGFTQLETLSLPLSTRHTSTPHPPRQQQIIISKAILTKTPKKYQKNRYLQFAKHIGLWNASHRPTDKIRERRPKCATAEAQHFCCTSSKPTVESEPTPLSKRPVRPV